MSDLGKGDAADFGEIPKGLKGIAALARKFGLRVTSGPITGYRTAEEQRRRSAIWPEVHDHYDHHGPRGSYHQPPPSKGLWQTPPPPRLEREFYDPIENAMRYLQARYPVRTCPHDAPPEIACPFCE